MMRRRPILYVTAAGTLVFSVLAIILGLRGIIVSLGGFFQNVDLVRLHRGYVRPHLPGLSHPTAQAPAQR